MSYVDRLDRRDVVDAKTFATYAHQRLGCPASTIKDITILRKQVKEFFAKNEQATWATMCNVVDWAKARKKRPHSVYVLVAWAKFAFADGYLPDLIPTNRDPELETLIEAALEVETDPHWRERLFTSYGPGRRVVYEEWLATHPTQHSA